MLRDNFTYYLGALLSILTVVGIISSLLGARRKKLDDAKTELDKAFAAGAKSRDDEIALLRSQRDDARTDRDDARRDRDLARNQLAYLQRPSGYPPSPGPPPPRQDS